MPFLSIVVPTFREGENIPVLIGRIDSVMSNARIPYAVIIVDDDSDDGTEEAARELGSRYPVGIMVRKDKRGLSSAVIDGIRESSGDIVAVMDADLSHPPEKLLLMVELIASGKADFVIGSRFVEGGGMPSFTLYRRLNAGISRLLARPLAEVKDPMAGFFAFRRTLLKDLGVLNPVGFKIGLEILVKTSPRKVEEIPIQFQERLFGRSKLSLREQMNYLLHLRRLYQYRYPAATRIAGLVLAGGTVVKAALLSMYVLCRFRKMRFVLLGFLFFLAAAGTGYLLARSVAARESGARDNLKCGDA
jgi:dolichol-phosphate mannosyltransferase